ncbi:MAG: archaetidylserine decarboxylase [Succinivibrionaceae bacterium]|nr:archaetidylserine decarboxylase [Succinivibrionaceae bacterium]
MSVSGTLLRLTEEAAPFGLLTSLSGRLASARLGPATQFLIRNFIRAFAINMDEVADPDPTHYETFNDFFVRRLREGVRPVDGGCALCCPVDGTVGEAGPIESGRLIQAKGIDYGLRDLLGGDRTLEAQFLGGSYACIYLSPSNYHRIHMPCAGTLRRTVLVPGRHFPVGRRNIAAMEGLYTRNERLVCVFDTDLGPLALVMVGAALVGGIFTTWGGVATHASAIVDTPYAPGLHAYERGDEIGGFLYGSTVVLAWPGRDHLPLGGIVPGATVRYGEPLAAAR